MENVIEWNVGLNDFKKCTLELGENSHKFTTKLLDVPFIIRSLGILSKSDIEYKSSKNQRLTVELAIMQLCSIKNELEKKKI